VIVGMMLAHGPLVDHVLVNLEKVDRSSVVGFGTRAFEHAGSVDHGAVWVPEVGVGEFLAKHRWCPWVRNLWGFRVLMGEQLRITVGGVGEVDRCDCLCISVPSRLFEDPELG